jgi:hypothetical protein
MNADDIIPSDAFDAPAFDVRDVAVSSFSSITTAGSAGP